jgi:hypothetical protein
MFLRKKLNRDDIKLKVHYSLFNYLSLQLKYRIFKFIFAYSSSVINSNNSNNSFFR